MNALLHRPQAVSSMPFVTSRQHIIQTLFIILKQ